MNEIVHCSQPAPMPPCHAAPNVQNLIELHNEMKLRTCLPENGVVADWCAGAMVYIFDPSQAFSSAMNLKLQKSESHMFQK
ncbi:hypothetical protein BDR03DRAFT_249186 [Suillus americanus]|nr:hypothetical protein BDR03DRAFT_249186 [Suillus americanus]